MESSSFFWRIETKGGRGPYMSKVKGHHCGLARWEKNVGDYLWRHPGPCDEGFSHFTGNKEQVFGFLNLPQMRRWFDEPVDMERWSKHTFMAAYPMSRCTVIDSSSKQAVVVRQLKDRVLFSLLDLYGKTDADLTREAWARGNQL